MARRTAIAVWPAVTLMALTLVAFLVARAGPPSLMQAGSTMLINMVIVVGLYMFIGNSGLFSFGHTAFVAVGAYVTAILTIAPETKEALMPELPGLLQDVHMASVPAIVVGGLSASALAALVGLPIVRMEPLAAALATFGVLAIVFNVAQNWQAVGGSTGVAEIPINTTIEVALMWALGAIALAFAYQCTRSCLRLRASREDEVAARSVGIPVERERHVAFVVSAFVVGVGGGLFAQNIGFFTPSAFFIDAAFLTIVMLLVGGMTSLAGAVVGTIVVSVVQEGLRRTESGLDLGVFEIAGRPGLQSVALALLLLAIMVRRPQGIVAGRELTWPFGRARDASGADPDEPAPRDAPAEPSGAVANL